MANVLNPSAPQITLWIKRPMFKDSPKCCADFEPLQPPTCKLHRHQLCKLLMQRGPNYMICICTPYLLTLLHVNYFIFHFGLCSFAFWTLRFCLIRVLAACTYFFSKSPASHSDIRIKLSLYAMDNISDSSPCFCCMFWTGYGFVDFESLQSAAIAVKALQAAGVQAQMAKVTTVIHLHHVYILPQLPTIAKVVAMEISMMSYIL